MEDSSSYLFNIDSAVEHHVGKSGVKVFHSSNLFVNLVVAKASMFAAFVLFSTQRMPNGDLRRLSDTNKLIIDVEREDVKMSESVMKLQIEFKKLQQPSPVI